MPFAILEKKINALPEKYLSRLSDYVDFLTFEAEKEKTPAERFDAMCAEAQAWAKEVGLTEQDITDTLKQIRRENREKREREEQLKRQEAIA